MKPKRALKDVTLVQLIDRFATDDIARVHLESIRWHCEVRALLWFYVSG